jgi:hypothetical protein
VRSDAKGGDGSKAKPFKDPYQALDKAEPGDTIHVAGGEYGGKLKNGHWVVDKPFIAMLGGYDAQFTARDPWERPSLLFWPADSKSTAAGYTVEATLTAQGFVLDGFTFDKRTQNAYLDNGDLNVGMSDKHEAVWVAGADSVVKNCTFVNGAFGALRVNDTLRIENNIFMNTHSFVTSLSPVGPSNAVTVFKDNTFLFVWNQRFGEGGTTSQGFAVEVRSWGKAELDGNAFAFIDNEGVKLSADPKNVSLINNAFAQNLYANVYLETKRTFIDDENFKSLPDLGLRKSADNQLVNCGYELDVKWFDAYLGRTAYVPGKVTMDDWNQLRELLGQPVLAKGGKKAEGMAPAYDYRKAAKLFAKNPKCLAGAKKLKL